MKTRKSSVSKPNRNERANPLDFQTGIFKKRDPAAIARSLKRTAQAGARRDVDPYRSAMGMLNAYINGPGRNLSKREHAKLERAKEELRVQFHRPAPR